MTPKETRAAIIECMEVGLVSMVASSPGLGKSSLVKQIGKDFNLNVIDIRMSQCAPEDLMGLPMRNADGKAEFVPFAMFPLEGDPLPEGQEGWILFLDEFNSAPKMVQAAAYKLVLDHEVGQYKLHPNCFIVCAGNLMTDRAVVTQTGTAMQSRLVHIEMAVSHEDFMEHATKADFDYRMRGFLEFSPSSLHAFKPDHQDKTFACPRTWEFVSKLIKGKSFPEVNLKLIAGAISEGMATSFYTFLEEYEKIPTMAAILQNPEAISIPHELSTRFAIISMMVDRFKEADFATLVPFIKRFTPEFQVIYFRGVVRQHPKFRRNPEYVKATHHLLKFLNDEEVDDTNTQQSNAA
jgi:hypothetical protein